MCLHWKFCCCENVSIFTEPTPSDIDSVADSNFRITVTCNFSTKIYKCVNIFKFLDPDSSGWKSMLVFLNLNLLDDAVCYIAFPAWLLCPSVSFAPPPFVNREAMVGWKCSAAFIASELELLISW